MQPTSPSSPLGPTSRSSSAGNGSPAGRQGFGLARLVSCFFGSTCWVLKGHPKDNPLGHVGPNPVPSLDGLGEVEASKPTWRSQLGLRPCGQNGSQHVLNWGVLEVWCFPRNASGFFWLRSQKLSAMLRSTRTADSGPLTKEPPYKPQKACTGHMSDGYLQRYFILSSREDHPILFPTRKTLGCVWTLQALNFVERQSPRCFSPLRFPKSP